MDLTNFSWQRTRAGAVAGTLLLCCFSSMAQSSIAADVAVREAAQLRPVCEPGHDRALKNGRVVIRPGETVCVTLRVDGVVVVPTSITTSDDPETTLIIRAWHEPGRSDTFMSLHNPLKSDLRYEATMFLPGRTMGEYTSSCPVLSQRFALEHWPYQIEQLQLSRFSLEPESEGLKCR